MNRTQPETREKQLRDALGVPPRLSDDAVTKHYGELLKLGSPLAFARQTFEDRAALIPGQLKVPARIEFDRAKIEAWHGGTPIPAEFKAAFAAWLDNAHQRTYAIGELERRLRVAVTATLTLAQSADEGDLRRAQTFLRWLAHEWQVTGLKPARDAAGAQAIDDEVRAAVRRRAGR